MEDLRTLPPRRTPVHAGTLLLVQDEVLAPSVRRGRATGARIEQVRLFDALSAWAAQAPVFSGAVEFPGAVRGDLLPTASGKYFNGSAAKKWKGGAFEAASVDALAAAEFSADTVDPLDGGGAGTSTIGRVDLPWASAAVRFVDLVEPAGGGTSRIRLKAPALPGDVDYTLPSIDGSAGQQLQTDGAGNLSWGGAEGTAAAILAKLLTVDGSGSLLDADFLDGLSSAAFAASVHAHAWSDVSKSGSSLADLATRSASDLSSGALAAARGGTNLDTSASTGVPVIAAGVWSVETPTGTGAPVRAIAPSLVAPALGTPASGVLTNCTGLPTAGLVDAAVTLAKIQDASAASKLLGRGAAAGAGDFQEIALGTGLSMSGTTLNAAAGAGDMILASAQSVTGAKTFDSSMLLMKETGGGADTITFASPALAGPTTITFPAVTATLATLAGTETLANKTLSNPAFNGTAATTRNLLPEADNTYAIGAFGNVYAEVRATSIVGGTIEATSQVNAVDFSASGNVLAEDDIATTGIRLAGSATAPCMKIVEASATPASPASSTQCNIYLRADKLVVQFNDGGTVRYKTMLLSGTGSTWAHSTTAPS